MPVLAINKKVKFDYQILETFEAGIVLSGQEVKSVRHKQASLKGAYISINKNQEVFLVNATIPVYKMAGVLQNYDATQPRKLLLNKKEINYLTGKLQISGLTLVPISLYTKHRKIKLEIALVKGKKKADKRQQIKERDDKRRMQQLLKQKMHK